jgi:hypothetical protein
MTNVLRSRLYIRIATACGAGMLHLATGRHSGLGFIDIYRLFARLN